MINHIKNLVIMLLVFSALFLTSEIWFGYIDGTFMDVFARGRAPLVDSEFKRDFALPMRIVTGDGSQNFRIVYGGMRRENQVFNFSDDILFRALSRDDTPLLEAPDFGYILSGNVIIYEYAFDMPVDVFMSAMGVHSSVLSAALEQFDKIVFAPYNNSGVNVYFHNQNTEDWVGLFVEGDEFAIDLRVIVRLESRSPYSLVYFASSYLLEIADSPYNNLFIPVWEAGGHRYFIGSATPAHFDITDGAVMNVIRANVMSFFDNPSVVYDVPTAGGFAWADENTIVRHFRTNVLQHISYRRDLRNSELLEDFARALSFIYSRDLLLTNDFYLAGFREQGNERIFYFEYILEGLPVIFSDDLRGLISDHTTSALTIRFRDGNLVSYTRLAYTFTICNDVTDIANRDLPLYILYSGLDLDSLESVTLAFVAPRLDPSGSGDMSLWVNFRMEDGRSAMETLR